MKHRKQKRISINFLMILPHQLWDIEANLFLRQFIRTWIPTRWLQGTVCSINYLLEGAKMKHIKNRAGGLARMALKSAFFMGCLAGPAHAAITFQFHYTDPAGTGFFDPVYGANRQAALNTAANAFSDMFGSHFSATGTIFLDADVDDTPGMLAGSTSDLINPGTPGFNLGEVVRTKLQTGVDLNGSRADGSLSVNFNVPWDTDINSPPTPYSGQYDFYGTLFHECTHRLGFSSGKSPESGHLFAVTKEE